MLVFDKETKEAQYRTLLTQPQGTVFKVTESDHATVLNRLLGYMTVGIPFEVVAINPGTSLFTMYGSGHCIVTVAQPQVA